MGGAIMEIHLVREPVPLETVAAWAKDQFGEMIKAVVDIERGVMAVGGELHADEEALLLEEGSRQQDLWGINLYPGQPEPDYLEFDSMINVRPSQGNRSRGVDDPALRERIGAIARRLITRKAA